uniref:C3H1-type domain-containing protein n=1 Tax=Araucaria cunninghamii TaxID=56994 RepID=A0A0D6R6X8_ARACU
MNPLTQVKNVQKITAREAAAGISEEASWHAKYKDSAYVFVGGVSYDLTEGDLLAVFAQYGEVVDVNLIRDKTTGKSKGFAFLAYQDQRSTILAVDNLNGATIVGRTVRVDHVANYKRKKEEDEEEEQQKREERGVCYAFQRGECTRGSACKFSHDEQRNANTGWGSKDDDKWKHDEYEHTYNRGQQTKPKYGQPFKGDDSQYRHVDTKYKERTTKEDVRLSKYDERKGSQNRLMDEKYDGSRHKNDGNRYVDTEPSRKRDNKREFGSGSRDMNEGEDGRRSRDAKDRDDGKKSRDTEEREDCRSKDTKERDDMKRSRETSERDDGRRSRDTNERDDGKRSRYTNERDNAKRSRDYSGRNYDRNVEEMDRREAKRHHR